MARPGLRKLTSIPIAGAFIGVPRAIYRAFSDDKDLVKSYFDLLKNSAVTAFTYAVLWVFYYRLSSPILVAAFVFVVFGAFTATAALWAQWTHHFGRIFRLRVGEALYPEYMNKPILSEMYFSDERLNGKNGVRFAKHFCVPRTFRAYLERALMFLFAYGLVAILAITLLISAKEITSKLLQYIAP
jgi:hypothetical protein